MTGMKPVAIRIPDSLYEKVRAIVRRRFPDDNTQGQIIRRALEQYVHDADGNGKTAKLDLLLVMGEEKRVLDAEFRRFVSEQFALVNRRMDGALKDEFSGCDNPPTRE